MTDEEKEFARLSTEFAGRKGFTTGKIMNAEGIKVNGKSFAYLSALGLVLKLPSARINALEADGRGLHLTVGKRVMNEWVVIGPQHIAEWHALAEESSSFVRGG